MPSPSRRRRWTPPVWEPWAQQLDAIFVRDDEPIMSLTERWRQARRGRLTASTRAEIIATRNPAQWNALAAELRRELAPDWEWEESDAEPLRWGRKYEPEALAAIELERGLEIVEPGLIFHQRYPFVAATPDAWIDDDGRVTVQVKCPWKTKNHLRVLYEKTLSPRYWWQVQWEAWCSRAEKIEFYSYDPRQPLATRLVRLDVPVNHEAIDRLDQNVRDFAAFFIGGTSLGEGTVRPEGIPQLFG